MTEDIKWAAMVPLVGGQAVGTKMALGKDPEAIYCFDAFRSNTEECERNFPKAESKTFKDDFSDFYARSDLDLVTLTCPCAGLSLSSSAGWEQRMKQNRWLLETGELLMKNGAPRAILGEGAPTLFTDMGRRVRDVMVESAIRNNYSVSFFRTNSVLHGIPQYRDRTFYVYWRSPTAPVVKFSTQKMPTLEDYLSRNPFRSQTLPEKYTLKGGSVYQFLYKLYGDNWRDVVLTVGRGNTYGVIERDLDLARQFADDDSLPDDWYRNAVRKMLVKHADGGGTGIYGNFPIMTVKKYDATPTIMHKYLHCIIHPTEDRFLSLEEMAHLMGLPGNFDLSGVREKNWNILCQNVTTGAARDATLSVKSWLVNDGSWYDSGEPLVFQRVEKDEVSVTEDRKIVPPPPDVPIDELMKKVA